MEDWQQRVRDEHKELVVKHLKLSEFFTTDIFAKLDTVDQTLLETQYLIMTAYGNILESRINRFQE